MWTTLTESRLGVAGKSMQHEQVLHQLMALFGEVAPVSSDEVLAIGVQQLEVTSSGEISWDMVRDRYSRTDLWGYHLSYRGSLPPHGCIPTTPSTPSPCALPRYNPAANGPFAVAVPIKKATICFILPYR